MGHASPPLSHGLRLLEFDAVLKSISRLAVSPAGAEHVRGIRPTGDPATARDRLIVVDEMVSLVMRLDWMPPHVPDVWQSIRRLGVEGSVLAEEELIAVGRLLASSREARADLRRDPDGFPHLTALGGLLPRSPDVEDRLGRSFGVSGELADGASRELRRLRSELRAGRSRLVRRLEKFSAGLPARLQVADGSVTVRAGRYCVPIRREGAGKVGGIVHDESSTHQTLYVEPPMAIDEMNKIASLERDEAREVRRILAELTELVRPLTPDLSTAFAVLAEADSLQARARYALGHGGVRPVLLDPSDSSGLTIVDGVHPLLLATEESAVPFSIRLGADESVLLISGPNAGGKTVTLKALGLLAALAQSGVIPPTGKGTSLPVFDEFYAVIGDEQSISASLSTFSAQMDAVREILELSGPESLVVLDEIGGNTDPAEGAALAAAILLDLSRRVALTVATTHLGELKDLAVEEPAIVNASLQFDAEALRPSFVLVRDRPGRSYAFEIAARLGLPEALLNVARGRVSRDNRRMEEVLKKLEHDEREASRLAGQTRVESRKLADREREIEERTAALVEREQAVEREARQRADRYLLAARREVENVIEGLTTGGTRPDPDAVRRARQEVESMLHANRDQAADELEERTSSDDPAIDPEPGDFVRSLSLGVAGRVTEVRSHDVTVESGGVRITVDRADLVTAERPPSEAKPDRGGTLDLPDIVPRPEVDLRGLRVDEVEGPLLSAIDAAFVADLGRVLVIHGTGTGALRKEVARLLRGDSRVASLNRGGFEEGGFGVTVVDLKGGEI